MGTVFQVKITHTKLSQDDIHQLKLNIDSALVEINRQMSTYDPVSEISRFNDLQDTIAFKVSPEFVSVIEKALDISEKSGYAFDVTIAPLVNLWGFGEKGRRIIPPYDEEISANLKNIGAKNLSTVGKHSLKKRIPSLRIDLGAIAKGYGVDVVTQILHRSGLNNFMVEIGGEVSARGLNKMKELWKIGIDVPRFANLPGQEIEAILALKDNSVATSGDYRNYFEYENKIYSHTIDPKTGRPVTNNMASATVVAKSCMEADALATAIMVLGKEKGLAFIESIDIAEAFIIVRTSKDTYQTFQSSGFSKYIDK
jgi:thiamine biosynthesis lipoprotein